MVLPGYNFLAFRVLDELWYKIWHDLSYDINFYEMSGRKGPWNEFYVILPQIFFYMQLQVLGHIFHVLKLWDGFEPKIKWRKTG